ncbi:unnamed protein product, partial [Mesorhabditis belari]|uniref:Cell wall hydrolase SleB domain-containing protein n=1 Tax=Mesorhabditis belari TaxID=2138241 RepID=A0AAF3FA91_9BILA
MSNDDKKNTIIVELGKLMGESVERLQEKSYEGLVDLTALVVLCHKNEWLPRKNMSTYEIMNKCMFELEKKGYGSVGDLLNQDMRSLVDKTCNWHEKNNGLGKVIDIKLDFPRAKLAYKQPDIIGVGYYDNLHSSQELHGEYTWTRTRADEHSVSFTKETHWTMSVATGVKFELQIPLIKKSELSLTVTSGGGGKETMNTTDKTVKTESFTLKNVVKVAPYKDLYKAFVVDVYEMDIPFTMIIETKSNERKTVTGTYHGTSGINERIEQKTGSEISEAQKGRPGTIQLMSQRSQQASAESNLSEREVFAQTVWGSAHWQPYEAWIWVAWVIKNRAFHNKPYWGGNFVKGVCLKPGQFLCWNDSNRRHGIHIDNPAHYAKIKELTDNIYYQPMSDDPTGGADSFNNPNTHGQPEWTKRCDKLKTINDYNFLRTKRQFL